MPRQIVDIQGLAERLPFSVNQLYKLTRHPKHPLPYKKCGKRLLFDLERVDKWFDSLPGRDMTCDEDAKWR
ncbi:helix-turn-helix transcriptional regulator [Thermodesulfobacteriota bacterium]